MERASVWAADTYREFVRIMEEEAEAEAKTAVAAEGAVATGASGASSSSSSSSSLSSSSSSGVRMREVFLYDDLPERPPRPAWAPEDLRCLTPEELPDIPAVYRAAATGGWKFGAPVVEMPRYLAHLRQSESRPFSIHTPRAKPP